MKNNIVKKIALLACLGLSESSQAYFGSMVGPCVNWVKDVWLKAKDGSQCAVNYVGTTRANSMLSTQEDLCSALVLSALGLTYFYYKFTQYKKIATTQEVRPMIHFPNENGFKLKTLYWCKSIRDFLKQPSPDLDPKHTGIAYTRMGLGSALGVGLSMLIFTKISLLIDCEENQIVQARQAVRDMLMHYGCIVNDIPEQDYAKHKEYIAWLLRMDAEVIVKRKVILKNKMEELMRNPAILEFANRAPILYIRNVCKALVGIPRHQDRDCWFDTVYELDKDYFNNVIKSEIGWRLLGGVTHSPLSW